LKPTITLRNALADPQLLGSLSSPSWAAWRVLLIAAMGEPLTDSERLVFTLLTGRAHEPCQRVEELVAVVGRRGGKSRAMATLAVYLAALCDHRDVLAPGETGVLLLIAPDQRQAAIALDYAAAVFEGSSILSQLVASRTNDTLALNNGIAVEVRAASFRRLRGPTYIGVIADEAAFWFSDESANPDTEILNAVRPGLSTTRGPLIIASSPYAKRGVLWEAHRKHHGPDGDRLVLVAQGSSIEFNPSLPAGVVERALERDRASAMAEYLAQFRDDIAAFVSFEIVSGCVGDHIEMAPRDGFTYCGFCDPSGGSADSFTMAIAHRDCEHTIIDAIREMHPPFSPEAVIDEFAALLKTYRIARVVGDRYAGEFPRELFRKRGIHYVTAEKTKSDLFRDLLPMLNSGRIVMPKSDRLVSQLCGLERRTARSGRDSIDHGPGGHDDLCNSVAGVADCVAAAVRNQFSQAAFGTYGTPDEPAERPSRLRDQMRAAIPPCLIDFKTIEEKRRPSNG
jgi:hypothetical protein